MSKTFLLLLSFEPTTGVYPPLSVGDYDFDLIVLLKTVYKYKKNITLLQSLSRYPSSIISNVPDETRDSAANSQSIERTLMEL
jgi:hypothetical protein